MSCSSGYVEGRGKVQGWGSPTLTSLRVSSGGMVQMGLRARCRYSITAAVERSGERDSQDKPVGDTVCFARGSLYKCHQIPFGQQPLLEGLSQ